MLARFGRLVARHAVVWILVWALLAVVLAHVAPDWDSVTQPGEFQFLPTDASTRVGERLFETAFPDDLLGSSVVLVLYRADGRPLSDRQQTFIHQTLAPQLRNLAGDPSANEPDQNGADAPSQAEAQIPAAERPIDELIVDVRTPSDESIGRLLQAPDGEAWLVIVDLKTEFLEHRNRAVVGRIDSAIERLRNEEKFPDGLSLAMTGSAAVGRDISQAKADSAEATEFWTIALVVTLLIVVFRAPLLAMVPLLTLYVGFKVALEALALAAEAGWIGLFTGIDTYTMVVVYGAGVDYSLFLSARVQEELARGAGAKAAVETAVEKVGSAVAASAGTEIFGIGMLTFASFGKLHQAGITISCGLVVMLAAALTLTPALLRLGSPWIFWPQSFDSERRDTLAHRLSPTRAVAWLFEQNMFEAVWGRVGRVLKTRPATVFAATIALMLIPAAGGLWYYNHLTYGLISQLSPAAPSVVGTNVLQRHFAQGETGHVTLLIERVESDFTRSTDINLIEELSDRLARRKEDLQIADIRSVAEPLGITEAAEMSTGDLSTFQLLARRAALRKKAVDYYVSETGEAAGTVTRMDIVLRTDPFTRNSIDVLNDLESAVRNELPDDLSSRANLHFIGPTASIRDLKQVANQDRIRINVLVVVAVLVVLVLLLRNLPLSLYLVVSVVFSYLAALGITYAVFWALDPGEFEGLDWTVPLFLFTILVAVGVDYNIFLVSRVAEEQDEHGPVDGVVEALTKTGAIISSCGVIMAGTFSSLTVGGELARMDQLGFALATGIALDTFLVRPVLVPAFLILVASGRLGLPRKWFAVSVGSAPTTRETTAR